MEVTKPKGKTLGGVKKKRKLIKEDRLALALRKNIKLRKQKKLD